MAGIERSDTQYADAEEDGLILHIELNEIPPTNLVPVTSDECILERHNDLKSSRPVKGHALDEPQGNSQHCQPQNTHTSPKAMAAQATEALNRTFIDLKSKNEENRLRASYDLRDLVVSAARGEAFCLPHLSSAQADFS